eukprot:gnl/Chilomastix_caulleri/2970.p2 GENE.gnl/Chilomastix_caulleri/2970~~gnl/Chilomastix_caulleri/2970.p2  ORF type:complete len:81 (+),score=20.02 gnl/Chilomastix_caulleri/2970:138-380(+)
MMKEYLNVLKCMELRKMEVRQINIVSIVSKMENLLQKDITMEQMIDICIPFMLKHDPKMTEEEARGIMNECMPKLERWVK